MAIRPRYLLLVLTLVASACTTWKTDFRRQQAQGVRERGPVANLAGARCADGHCRCRTSRDPAEASPPPPGKKRIELRMSSSLGSLTLDSPTAGHFEHPGDEEACYYVDLDVNQLYTFHLASKEAHEGTGVAPMVHISEYGPIGHFWYDIVEVACGFGDRACDPGLARTWGQNWLDKRKRGRLDACGSLVVVGLKWGTSGGQSEANGWRLRDFNADFGIEVKKFATEFPPHAPECQIGH